MKIIIWGAAGFIGKNLTMTLAATNQFQLTLVDKHKEFFFPIDEKLAPNIQIKFWFDA